MTTVAFADVRAPAPSQDFAVVVLIDDETQANSLARLLEGAPERPGLSVRALVPPQRGIEFFDGTTAQRLDAWWAENVPPDAAPVWVITHHERLVEWIDSVDGLFVIIAEHMAPYAGRPRVTCVPPEMPLDVLSAVTREVGDGRREQSAAVAAQRQGSRRRVPRDRFRRAELRGAEDDGAPAEPVSGGSQQLFQSTGAAAPVGDTGELCHELIDVLGKTLHRLRQLTATGTAG